ncbi:MAG TPA: type IV toxin-antitoxin system AbiEi family antitoxin domain-containing protein [Planctomycetota bacterium]|nr:type IV toxin-antitoxin system AbiEi family antitoxin domain-containing protein [Planctomycetota bacterium]
MPIHRARSPLEVLRRSSIGAFFRLRGAEALGVSYYDLQRGVERGEVEQVGRGLYRLTDVEPDETETIASVAAAAPHAIVCLLSALRIHNIGTQNPSEVWIALERTRRKPANLPARVRIVRFSGRMLTYGVVDMRMLGVPVHVTNPARTVVDCFRYRNKIGVDVALEALRETLRLRKASVDQIMRTAELCRARTVVRRYLEALP